MISLASFRRVQLAGTVSVISLVLMVFWFMRSPSGEWPLSQMPDASLQRPTVTLRQGTFVGTELTGQFPQTLEQFLGVPYGLSTAGVRRFRPPVRVNSSDNTFDASRYGNRCPSGEVDEIPTGEDCLNANIYRPREWDRRMKLPVLVHLHGGAFNFGSGQTRDIASLVAWSTEPMIGITFNYRTGALGFLSSNLTAREGLLNVGLRDQVLMLEWIQENIAKFGGNPNSVTLMGVSAGAHSVSHCFLIYSEAAFCAWHLVSWESSLAR